MPRRFTYRRSIRCFALLVDGEAFAVDLKRFEQVFNDSSTALPGIILQVNGDGEQTAAVALTQLVGMPQDSQRIEASRERDRHRGSRYDTGHQTLLECFHQFIRVRLAPMVRLPEQGRTKSGDPNPGTIRKKLADEHGKGKIGS
jgi:hypothetical protein